MNRIQFEKYLEPNFHFQEKDLKDIQDLEQEYPWFNLLYAIQSKGAIKLQKDYQDYLRLASLYASDRSQLFQYLFIEEDTVAAPKQEEKKQEYIDIKPKASPEKSDLTAGDVSEQLRKIEAERKARKKESLKPSEESATLEPKKTEATEKNTDKAQADKEIKETTNENEVKAPIPQDTKDKNKPTDEIIGKFMREEPKINRPADGPYDETLRLAKESLEEHYDFVSETLAEIYFKQENIEKAVKIYKQLILKNPEKKRYFAARIKEIVENK